MTTKSDELTVQYLSKSIKTVDGAHEYPVDEVRELFMVSDKNLQELAVQLNLPLALVEQHAKAGLRSWQQLKEEHLTQRLKHFAEVDKDNLLETHSLLEDGHLLTIVQFKGMQTFLKAYYAKYGHLFLVNDEGEVALDSYGVPIPIPLPNTPKHFMALEGFFRLKEGTKQQMQTMYEASKEESKSDVVDVDSYGLFDEEK